MTHQGCISGRVPTSIPLLGVDIGGKGILSMNMDGDTIDNNLAKMEIQVNVRAGLELSFFAIYFNANGFAGLEALVPHEYQDFPQIVLFSITDFAEHLIASSGLFRRVTRQFRSKTTKDDFLQNIEWSENQMKIWEKKNEPLDPKRVREAIFKAGLNLGKLFSMDVKQNLLYYQPQPFFEQYKATCFREVSEESTATQPMILNQIETMIQQSMPPATLDELFTVSIERAFFKIFLGDVQNSQKILQQKGGLFHKTFKCREIIKVIENPSFEALIKYHTKLRICWLAKAGFASESDTEDTNMNLRHMVSHMFVFPHNYQTYKHLKVRNASYDAQVMASRNGVIDLKKDKDTIDEFLGDFRAVYSKLRKRKCFSDLQSLYKAYLKRLDDLADSVRDDAKKFVTLLRITEDKAAYEREWRCTATEDESKKLREDARAHCGGDTGNRAECARNRRRLSKLKLCGGNFCVPIDAKQETNCETDDVSSCPTNCTIVPLSRLDFTEAWSQMIRRFDGNLYVDEMTPEERSLHEQVRNEREEAAYQKALEAKRVDSVVEAMADPNLNWILRRTTSNDDDSDELDFVGWMRLLSFDHDSMSGMLNEEKPKSRCGDSDIICGCGVKKMYIGGAFSVGVSAIAPSLGVEATGSAMSFCAGKNFEANMGVKFEWAWERNATTCSLDKQSRSDSIFLNVEAQSASVEGLKLGIGGRYGLKDGELEIKGEFGLPSQWFKKSDERDESGKDMSVENVGGDSISPLEPGQTGDVFDTLDWAPTPPAQTGLDALTTSSHFRFSKSTIQKVLAPQDETTTSLEQIEAPFDETEAPRFKAVARAGTATKSDGTPLTIMKSSAIPMYLLDRIIAVGANLFMRHCDKVEDTMRKLGCALKVLVSVPFVMISGPFLTFFEKNEGREELNGNNANFSVYQTIMSNDARDDAGIKGLVNSAWSVFKSSMTTHLKDTASKSLGTKTLYSLRFAIKYRTRPDSSKNEPMLEFRIGSKDTTNLVNKAMPASLYVKAESSMLYYVKVPKIESCPMRGPSVNGSEAICYCKDPVMSANAVQCPVGSVCEADFSCPAT